MRSIAAARCFAVLLAVAACGTRPVAQSEGHIQPAVQPPTPFLRNPALSEADAGTAQLEQLSLKANFWSLDQGNPVLEHDVLYAGLRGTPLPSADVTLIGQ